LWVTNRERLRAFVERELLPAWGLEHAATWHWVKITDGGELVTPMVPCPSWRNCEESELVCARDRVPERLGHGVQDAGSRRPYEALLLLRPKSSQAAAAAGDGDAQQQPQQPRDKAIFAVPGQHSRKPHLGRLLQPLLPSNAACLEVRNCACVLSALDSLRRMRRSHRNLLHTSAGVNRPPCMLQMFARELAAGWTSWGNEVLRFQTLDNFVEADA
jgi:hypothetical protein